MTLLLISYLCYSQSSLQKNRRPLWLLRERQRRRNHQRLAFPGRSKSDQRHPMINTQQISKRIKNLERQLKEIENQEGKEHMAEDQQFQHEREGNEKDDDAPKLNVTDEDSPYALISDFFQNQEANHNRRKNEFKRLFMDGDLSDEQIQSIGDLKPQDIWLSEGDLLILKGGQTLDRSSFDNPWEPLDDYEAPYKEPKLPPPDFVPVEFGVGVPLPNEGGNGNGIQELEEINEVAIDNDHVKSMGRTNIYHHNQPSQPSQKTPVLDDEQKLINAMENFHSVRKSRTRSPELDQSVELLNEITSAKPSWDFAIHQTTPESYLYSYVVSTSRTPHAEKKSRKSRTSLGQTTYSSLHLIKNVNETARPSLITSPLHTAQENYYQPHLPETILSRSKSSIFSTEQPFSVLTTVTLSPRMANATESNFSPTGGTQDREKFRSVLPTPHYRQTSNDVKSHARLYHPYLPILNNPETQVEDEESTAALTLHKFVIPQPENSYIGKTRSSEKNGHIPQVSATHPKSRASRLKPPELDLVRTILRDKSPQTRRGHFTTYHSVPSQLKSREPNPSEIRSLPLYQQTTKTADNKFSYEEIRQNSKDFISSPRRSDERYVSFFRGNVGERTWGYSYRL